MVDLNEHVIHYVAMAGFIGATRLNKMNTNHILVTIIVEHFCQETHTFHLHVDEASVTLQHVADF